MNESARSIPSKRARTDGAEQRGAAVGAVDVQPQPALGADVGDAGEVVHDPGVRRSRARHHREQAVGSLARRAPRAAADPVSRPRSSLRHRDDVHVHHPGRGQHGGVRACRRRRSPTAPAAHRRATPAAWRAATSAERFPAGSARRRTRRRHSPAGPPGRRSTAAPGSRPRSAPAPSIQLPPRGRGGADDEVEEHARLGRRARHEREERRVVGRDRRRREHLGPDAQRLLAARCPPGVIVCPARRASSSAGRRAVERRGVRDPARGVGHDRAGQLLGLSSNSCIAHRSSNAKGRPEGRPRRFGRYPFGRRSAGELRGRTRRTRRCTSGRRPRCAAPRSSTAPRRRGS